MPTPELPQWHLKERMALCGLRTIASLRDAMAGRGVSLSQVHVGRLIRGVPERLSMRQLKALCEVLHCTPGDLLTVTLVSPPATVAARPPPSTVPAVRPPSAYLQSMSEADRARLIGPRARALSAHPLSKEGS